MVNVIANEELSRLQEPSNKALTSIAATHSGNLVATGDCEGTVTLWREPAADSI